MASKSKIITGLEQAVAYSRGNRKLGSVHKVEVDLPLDVRAIRVRQGLSQSEFATKYGFAVSTLRNWEQGRRAPTGASRNFLIVIDKLPTEVWNILATAT